MNTSIAQVLSLGFQEIMTHGFHILKSKRLYVLRLLDSDKNVLNNICCLYNTFRTVEDLLYARILYLCHAVERSVYLIFTVFCLINKQLYSQNRVQTVRLLDKLLYGILGNFTF